eukprot:scaffold51067_cov66-Phaeocystis_antarctica.AAC.7
MDGAMSSAPAVRTSAESASVANVRAIEPMVTLMCIHWMKVRSLEKNAFGSTRTYSGGGKGRVSTW